MSIREANIKDIEQIIGLWKETGLYFAPFDKEERLIDKIKKEPELFLVAEKDNKVVGAIIGNYGWRVSIDHLAVDEKYREQGIGKSLIENIKNNLKNKGATMALLDSNLPRNVLEKLGCNYRETYANYTIEL